MLVQIFSMLGLVLLLSSCGLGPTAAPADHYYRLPDVQGITPLERKYQQIRLAPVKASGVYNERAILYRKASSPLEIRPYNYHYWTQTPAQLVSRYMRQYLQQSSIATNIVLSQQKKNAELIIRTELIHFERLLDNQQASADIALRIEVNGVGRRYHASVAADSLNMHSSIEAFARALDEILQQLMVDITSHSIPPNPP